MTERISTFISKMGLCAVVLAVPLAVFPQDKPFTVGIRGGFAVPQNSTLQGSYFVSYDAGGAPDDVYISGFGDGGEVALSISYTSPDGSAWLVELGARILNNKANLTLAPDGKPEVYDNYLNTIFPIAVSRIYRFFLERTSTVPYMGAGVGFYSSYWNTMHEYYPGETLNQTAESTEFTGLGLHGIAGFHRPLYYDILLEAQLKYTWIPSNVRIVDDEDGTWITHENLNIGGVSLMLGLAYSF
ncbi:MAG: hypothetical protein JSU77_02430 [Fidelibacterota bacterium]|nr:MAG: hypothetical protein JSU77_02430 [Candidatus Neomarinimicrobiota bacterium]